ncbi:MAG: DNA repair protein RecO [Wenzhouxiangella sp.]|nr:DNA repair protein RecO [Wenzhouxiangella sp.]
MSPATRAGQATQTTQGWVLHRRPWRESSALVDVLTQDFGRLGLVAKGARSQRSAWRGLVEPFVPLSLSYSQKGEMGTLRSLETNGQRVALSGTALWCGLYANELVLYLIDRDDAVEGLFEAYSELVMGLGSDTELGATLRLFEWRLLTLLGVAPSLDQQAHDLGPITLSGHYRLESEAGFVAVAQASADTVSGEAIGWLTNPTASPACSEVAQQARHITRQLIDHQLAGRTLKTRALLRQLQ